jgi:hypothetical protein
MWGTARAPVQKEVGRVEGELGVELGVELGEGMGMQRVVVAYAGRGVTEQIR